MEIDEIKAMVFDVVQNITINEVALINSAIDLAYKEGIVKGMEEAGAKSED